MSVSCAPGGDLMNTTLIELARVLAPWLVLAVVVPLMLYALRALFRAWSSVSGALTGARERLRLRRSFAPYVRRGFY